MCQGACFGLRLEKAKKDFKNEDKSIQLKGSKKRFKVILKEFKVCPCLSVLSTESSHAE
jgi:hypothetical protein